MRKKVVITLSAAMTVTGMLAGCSGTEETTENADAVQEKIWKKVQKVLEKAAVR